jgi:hypothetical protein
MKLRIVYSTGDTAEHITITKDMLAPAVEFMPIGDMVVSDVVVEVVSGQADDLPLESMLQNI